MILVCDNPNCTHSDRSCPAKSARASVSYRDGRRVNRASTSQSIADAPSGDPFAPEHPTDLPPSYRDVIASTIADKGLPSLPEQELELELELYTKPEPGPKDQVDFSVPKPAPRPVQPHSPNPSFSTSSSTQVSILDGGAISEPACFSRMPNPAFSYCPFTTVWLYTKNRTLDHGWPCVAPRCTVKQVHPFATHDVREQDWRRSVAYPLDKAHGSLSLDRTDSWPTWSSPHKEPLPACQSPSQNRGSATPRTRSISVRKRLKGNAPWST
jgi:hypothetical protein